MHLPIILYNLRISRALTLTELANRTGISITSLSAYERGYYSPTLENLCNLANFFHVSLDVLVGREVPY